jgi:SEC-C motif-containing protein
MHGKPLAQFNEQEAPGWSQSVYWLGLKVITSWQEDEHTGFVEFIASFIDKNSMKTIHETSEFVKINNSWFYTDGKHIPKPTTSISRNALCPCGSQKKFKNCHEKDL